MNIKNKIAEITAGLRWPVKHASGGRDIEITSDPWSRTHIIKIPTVGPEWRDIEYLHELAHAVLSEKHHLLSTAYFLRGTAEADIAHLTNPCRCASDWYADALLMQWCPDEEKREIREHADYAKLLPDPPDPEMMYMGGLMLAQAAAYLGDDEKEIPSPYRPVVITLLEDFPPVPSIRTKNRLINRLASLTIPQRVHICTDDGMDVWLIKK